jgi:hypothetical protein
MIKWLKRLIFGRDLSSARNETKRIRIDGFNFTIKKLDAMDYIQGHSVLIKTIDLIDNKRLAEKTTAEDPNYKKIRDHYIDVFLSGVVYPSLSRKGEGASIHVDELFQHGNLCEKLYLEIIQFTYGKKKLNQNI